jgi:hypothetical protein
VNAIRTTQKRARIVGRNQNLSVFIATTFAVGMDGLMQLARWRNVLSVLVIR